MSQQYDYTKTPLNLLKLKLEIEAEEFSQTLVSLYASENGSNNLHIIFQAALTSGEEDSLDALVVAHDGQPPTTYARYCRNCAQPFEARALAPPASCPCCESQDIIDPAGTTPSVMAEARSLVAIAPGETVGYAGNQSGYVASHGFYAVEAPGQLRLPKCKVRRLSINISTNTLNSSSTLTVRKNGASQSLILTVAAGATGSQSAAGEVSFADGDLFSIEVALGGTGGQGFYPKGGHIEIITEV